MDVARCYRSRFSRVERVARKLLWKNIYKYALSKYIHKDDVVMDLGAGYCELINAVESKHRIAVDLNPDVKKSAAKGVKVLVMNVFDIPRKFNGRVDVVIISHFLEHLNSKDEMMALLQRVKHLLKDGGKILILQPNISLTKERYWDFVDHKIALNALSVVEALKTLDFKDIEVVERFLPYSTKSFLGNFTFLVHLYLLLPSFLRPFAGQSFFCAIK